MGIKPERRIAIKDFKTICRAIATYEDLDLLFNHFVEVISRAFNVKGCSLLLFDEHEKQLIRVSSFGISKTYLNKGPVFMDDKESAFVKCEPVFVEDMQNDPRVQYPEAAAKEGFVSMLSIPIRSREAVVGVFRMYFDETRTIHEEDVDSLCVLTELLGLVIENNGLKNFLEQVKMALDSLPTRLL